MKFLCLGISQVNLALCLLYRHRLSKLGSVATAIRNQTSLVSALNFCNFAPMRGLSSTIGMLLGLLLCGGMLSGCQQITEGNIPERNVNFTVRPYDMDNVLLPVGGFKYFNYGYSGVFVYHIGDMEEEYVAFEQACPLDWEDGCYVEYDKPNECLVGRKCSGEYSTYNGFGKSKNVSRYTLRKYHITYLSGGNFQVSN